MRLVIGLLLTALALSASGAAAQPGPPGAPHCRAALPQNRPGATPTPPGMAGRCIILPPGCAAPAFTAQIGPPPNCNCVCRPRMPQMPGAPAPPGPGRPPA